MRENEQIVKVVQVKEIKRLPESVVNRVAAGEVLLYSFFSFVLLLCLLPSSETNRVFSVLLLGEMCLHFQNLSFLSFLSLSLSFDRYEVRRGTLKSLARARVSSN